MLRHIGSRRHGDDEVEAEELFDAAATDGSRADSVKRSEPRLLWLSLVNEVESVIGQSPSVATHGILPACRRFTPQIGRC